MRSPLIDAEDLRRHLADRLVLDVRWRLGGPPGRADYERGHVPGAVFLDLDTELSGAPGSGGRHPLPDPRALQETLRRAGLTDGSAVVAYDGGDGVAAARAWWVLRWAGVRDVAVLDGGWPAWIASGGGAEMETARPAYGDVVVRPSSMPVLDADAAARVAREGVLLDARAPERFRGEQEPVDAVAGHIPGAINAPVADPESLRLLVGERRPVGAYCGSGVTAAKTVLALAAAGVDAALYVGSWSQWITDPDRPVAIGE